MKNRDFMKKINTRKEEKIENAIKLLEQIPQPERSIFLHKLMIAAGILKPKKNDGTLA